MSSIFQEIETLNQQIAELMAQAEEAKKRLSILEPLQKKISKPLEEIENCIKANADSSIILNAIEGLIELSFV